MKDLELLLLGEDAPADEGRDDAEEHDGADASDVGSERGFDVVRFKGTLCKELGRVFAAVSGPNSLAKAVT